MAEITKLQIRRLAEQIRLGRDLFASAYDEFAIPLETPTFKQIAQEKNTALPLAAGPDQDRRDMNAALQVASENNWLVDFVFDKFTDLAAGTTPKEKLRLQSIVNRKQAFVDAKMVEAGTIAASRRCCQILITRTDEGKGRTTVAEGSGFLIGPHLVLTNHHVIRDLLDAGGLAADPRLPRPQVQFDVHQGARWIDGPEVVDCASDWLVATSQASSDTDKAVDLKDKLDFAVLKLAGLPGHARGWYDLSKIEAPPPVDSLLELWQFPNKQPMKVLPGPRAMAPTGEGYEGLLGTEVPPRIFYKINSLQGSSGGLVLDVDRKQPVGLHEAGYENNTPEETRSNRGIPLSLIRDHAGSRVSQELQDIPQKIGWHPTLKEPILGRNDLQQLIFNARRGSKRIITVMTRPDGEGRRIDQLGRTFTRVVLEACLPSDEHRIIDFNAALIDPDPFLTARRIVQALDTSLTSAIPTASGETTMDADATGVLADACVKALIGALPGKTVWLMIDDIDAYPIGTQWGSSSFLIALYRRAVVEPALRIVLVGLPRELEGLADLMANSSTSEVGVERLDVVPSEQELSFWVQAHLADAVWPSEFGPRLARLVRSVAKKMVKDEIALAQANGGALLEGQRTMSLTEATAKILTNHARTAFLAKASEVGNG
jgi:Trypsin-like peptidase domain